ncbi:MAG: cytochrome D1 domain-containing protein [Acidobacteriota bacterium]
MQLGELQRELARFTEMEAEVWAISIDPAEKLRKTRKKLGLTFLNLMDPGSRTIERFGILNRKQGHIPHPTALVVDKRGIIRYLRTDENYKKRPSSRELLRVLAGIHKSTAARGTLIVANKSDATVSLVDLPSGEVQATVPTGQGPHEVGVSPDGTRAVVTNYGTREAPGSTLTVIDIARARVLATIDLDGYHRPHGIQWLADNRRILVTSEESQALLTVDMDTGQVTGKVGTGQDISHMVAVTPEGTRAFVANIGSGSVTAIDLERQAQLANIPTGEGAEGITVTPDGTQVWVTNRAADTVTVIDAASLKILKVMESKSFPIRVKATADGNHLLVSNARSGELAVFDAHTLEEVRRLPMNLSARATEGRLFGGRFGDSPVPIGILVHPDGRWAYVASTNADVVSIIDLETWTIAGRLRPGREPDGLGFSPLAVNRPGAAATHASRSSLPLGHAAHG